MLAAAGLALFYVLIVAGASQSWAHLAEQTSQDRFYLGAIVAGFGTQVGLMSELRRRHRLHHGATAAGGAGAGASTVGMVACCAHHLADLAPFVGLTGAAAFMTDYRVPFMVVGISVNAIGVAFAALRLHGTPDPAGHRSKEGSCAAAA
ncbi:hypothetical protein HC251_18480 [Iamia sp. SCSIO 61187]|uniref:hypothetical protein n=1 Tax=Iamia sp. SCSIO 61187 TaxID=2722752 RepID=UPI001C627778|nr:hypothetical protein [Iamia sp. SCSIO 61187]QYG94227.1 hypothetical protein HC251_18480 [Iamia sp. SCSIO 61187]